MELRELLPIDATKALIDLLHPDFRMNFDYSARRDLTWGFLMINSSDDVRDHLQDMWDNMLAGGREHRPWASFSPVCKSFDPSRYKPNPLELAMRHASWGPTSEEKEEQSAKLSRWKSRFIEAFDCIEEWDDKYDAEYVRSFMPLIEKGKTTILCKAACGLGKSVAVRAVLEEFDKTALKKRKPFRFLYITNRVANARNAHFMLSETMVGVGMYQQGVNRDKLVIEMESLFRIPRQNEYDAVIIDESESVLKQLYSPTNRQVRAVVENITWAIKTAKVVMLCDAYLSKRTLTFARELRPLDTILTTWNARKPERRVAYDTTSFERLVTKVIENIEAGERVYCVIQTKKAAKQLHDKLSRIFPDKVGRLYTGEGRNGAIQKELENPNKSWLQFDWLITTLTITVGVDFDRSNHFTTLFVSATSKHCGDLRDVFQAMHRVRKFISNKTYYYLDDTYAGAPYGLSPDTIRKNLSVRNFIVKRERAKLNKKGRRLVKKYDADKSTHDAILSMRKKLEELQNERSSSAKNKRAEIDIQIEKIEASIEDLKAELTEEIREKVDSAGFSYKAIRSYIDYLPSSESPEWFKELEIYKIHEEAMTTAGARDTWNGLLAIDNYTQRKLKKPIEDAALGKVDGEQHMDYEAIPDIDEELDKARTLLKKLMEEDEGPLDRPDVTPEKDTGEVNEVRDRIERLALLKDYRSNIDDVTEIEGWMQRKHYFQAIIDVKKLVSKVPEDLQSYELELRWRNWTSPKDGSMRSSCYIVRAIKRAREEYDSQTDFTGSFNEFFIASAYKDDSSYPEMYGRDVLTKKYAIEMLTTMARDLSLEQLRDGTKLELKDVKRLDKYITKHENDLKEGLRMKLRTKKKKERLPDSEFDLKTLNIFIKKTLGTSLRIDYARKQETYRDSSGKKKRRRVRAPAGAFIYSVQHWDAVR